MTEPEPFPGWRAVRDRALKYISEGPEPLAASFLEDCPVIDGSYDPDTREMRLVFLCSRGQMSTLEQYEEVYDEVTNSIRTVLPHGLADLQIECQYGTPDELTAFREAGHLPARLPAGEST